MKKKFPDELFVGWSVSWVGFVGGMEGGMLLQATTEPVRATVCASMRVSAKRFLHEYVRECQPTDQRAAARLSEALQRLKASIDDNDVVLLVKPGGLCPFCNLAITLLRREQASKGFTLSVADLLHDEREGLKVMLASELGERILTYPIIFIKGVRVAGGFEELKSMQESADGLTPALSRERVEFAPPDLDGLFATLPGKSDRPRLFYQAGGGPWFTFQTLLFGNVLRLIALFQVLLLVLALVLYDKASSRAAAVVAGFVGADAALFVLFGPTPLEPLGALATLLMWRRRGSVASAVPYKFTFILYAAGCLANLPCAFGDGSSNCSLPHGRSLLTTLLVNSSILAIFRF